MHRSLYFLFLTLQTDEYIFKDMSLFQTSKIFQQIYFTLRHRLLHALLSLLCRLVHSGYGKLHPMPPDTTYGSRIVLHLVIVEYNVRVGMKMARQEVCFIAIQ